MSQNRSTGSAIVMDMWMRADKTPKARYGTGKRWTVRWVNFEGKQLSKSFELKRDAVNFRDEVTAELAAGTYINPSDAKMTVGKFHEAWEKGLSQLKPTTASSRKSIWKNHVKPRWSQVQVGNIRAAHINEWVTDLHEDGKSPDLIYQAVIVLRAVLQVAIDSGKLRSNPAQRINIPGKDESPRPYLTVAQVDALAGEIGHYSTLVKFLAFTGLRWGEAAALRVRSINLDTHRIDVSRAITTPGGKRVEGSPKSRKTRSVPFPSVLDEKLIELMDGRALDEFLFTSVEGSPVDNSNFRARWFRPAVKRCHDADASFPMELTIHDLRHTAASLAVSAGANVLALQRMLGHKKPSITLDVYSDLFDDDLDSVAEKLNTLIVGNSRVKRV